MVELATEFLEIAAFGTCENSFAAAAIIDRRDRPGTTFRFGYDRIRTEDPCPFGLPSTRWSRDPYRCRPSRPRPYTIPVIGFCVGTKCLHCEFVYDGKSGMFGPLGPSVD